MGKSWKIGRVAGINLFLHPTLLLLAAWAWSSDCLLLTAAVLGCVLLHELGHALTARAFGIPTRDITLTPIGGVARLERMPRAPGAELLITLAGPMVNVAIAAAVALALWAGGGFGPWASGGFTSLEAFALDLLAINIVLAVFNMIPAFPMDGGRVLRALLSGAIGRYRATEIAVSVGRVAAVGLGAYGLLSRPWHPMLAVMAVFLFVIGNTELAAARAEEAGRRGGGDRDGDGPGDGVWIAPPGHRWVSNGGGVWQAIPIRVESNPWGRGPWR